MDADKTEGKTARELIIEGNIKRSQERKEKARALLPVYPFPLDIEGCPVKYYHLRNTERYTGKKTHEGGVTIAMALQGGRKYHVGISLCSVDDNFGRPKGRFQASYRLRTSMSNVLNDISGSPHVFFTTYSAEDWTPKGILADIALKLITNHFDIPSPCLWPWYNINSKQKNSKITKMK